MIFGGWTSFISSSEDSYTANIQEWTLLVEKNDEDQKIEQDGVKPEDKAHKAATKIQASFRGHITRKKLKGEKKGDAPAAEAEANEKKDDAPVADGVEKKEGGPAATDAAPATSPKADEPSKAGDAPSEEKKDGPAKEEPKQANVPAAVTDAAATTPAAEDAATKAAQPPTETAESSQAEEEKAMAPLHSERFLEPNMNGGKKETVELLQALKTVALKMSQDEMAYSINTDVE
ncbi:Neuromodulin [Microtus ochrogaster]|uniref:Neuromodulin n=1 Tax=Microtus ochrogaster TaxID=79684 RepID=A0A8J6GLD1_MICOH|nr:Neuromodulin [Microtus ochrogaster]